MEFDHLCKEKLTLDTIELYDEPIVLFTDLLCSIAKSCMPRTTAKQKKRCKPWFNTECKDALKARKSALVRFKTNITTDNLSNFRVARAKARRACRENKRASWQQYVSRLNSRTTLKSTWDMVRRISGKYKANTVSHLKYNDNDITDVKEICNTLAAQFAFNSTSDNYSHVFNRHRLTIEQKTIDFDTIDHFPYNDVFTLHELKQAIKISRDTSPGIDTVHYQLLKHLPEYSLLLLLYIFNHILLTQDFHTSWKTAIIIPVAKPGKVLTDPGSYRPIALTSCLCTMERMVNIYPDPYSQEEGLPQGSILSVTLFSLKINSIVSCLLPDIKCSLYVDDLSIYYSSSHMPSIERKLQHSLNRLGRWCDENGFKFSPTKTMCVHFCQLRKLHLDPKLYLNDPKFQSLVKLNFLVCCLTLNCHLFHTSHH